MRQSLVYIPLGQIRLAHAVMQDGQFVGRSGLCFKVALQLPPGSFRTAPVQLIFGPVSIIVEDGCVGGVEDLVPVIVLRLIQPFMEKRVLVGKGESVVQGDE